MIFRQSTRKTLYLHIGHYKTGTTALQLAFDQSRAALRRAGLDYLSHGSHYSKHSAFAFALLRAAGVTTLMHGYDDPATPDALWSDLFDAVRQSRSDRCLISTEDFMRIGVYPGAIEGLDRVSRLAGEDITVRVIAYLRARIEALEQAGSRADQTQDRAARA